MNTTKLGDLVVLENTTCYIEDKPIYCYNCNQASYEHLVIRNSEVKRVCMICGNQVNKRRNYGRGQRKIDL